MRRLPDRVLTAHPRDEVPGASRTASSPRTRATKYPSGSGPSLLRRSAASFTALRAAATPAAAPAAAPAPAATAAATFPGRRPRELLAAALAPSAAADAAIFPAPAAAFPARATAFAPSRAASPAFRATPFAAFAAFPTASSRPADRARVPGSRAAPPRFASASSSAATSSDFFSFACPGPSTLRASSRRLSTVIFLKSGMARNLKTGMATPRQAPSRVGRRRWSAAPQLRHGGPTMQDPRARRRGHVAARRGAAPRSPA